MDADLRQFQTDALAEAVTTWDRQVTMVLADSGGPSGPSTLVLHGVQSPVDVDPEQLKEFGYDVKRVFSLVVADATIMGTLKIGMAGTDDQNMPCRLVHYRRGTVGCQLFFGSVNR